MSFTAQVKDELSRVEGSCASCSFAQLSAIVRVCGTLSFRGSGRYALRMSTETGAVARTLIKLVHELFTLDTQLTVRRSNLHKTRNFLIEIPEQDELEADLVSLGILVPGRGLARGVPKALLENDCCKRSFLRGAFMAGGFIADPRGDFHLEIAVTGEEFAQGIIGLFADVGIQARLSRRRGSWVIYLKSYEDTMETLKVMGSVNAARAVERVRELKTLKNDVNRRVNAEVANQARSVDAASGQLALIRDVKEQVGIEKLSRALREFCILREAHPELSLAALGKLSDPPASKSAMYHRYLRLLDVAREHGIMQ